MSDLSIQPVYLSARAAIVAPERAIPVTLYSTSKWLPRLGPERWCLVLLLRSLCIDTQRRSDGTKRLVCSWRQLAEMLDVHEETIASWLKHEPIPHDKPWRRIISNDNKATNLALFIPRLRYAYETQQGKTRRVGFLLEVVMEDHVVPEDEPRLLQQVEMLRMQQGELGLETYRVADQVSWTNADLRAISDQDRKQPNSDSHYVNQVTPDLPSGANPVQLDLHNRLVNPENTVSRTVVKQGYLGSDTYVNPRNDYLRDDKPSISGKNVNELDILIQQVKQKNIRKNLRKNAFDPILELTETLLDDKHSRGMLYKVLNALYPERLDLYVAAVRVSLETAGEDPNVNRGAVFVRALREFADVAGVDLGLKRAAGDTSESQRPDRNPGSQTSDAPASALNPPSAHEAIWAETQAVLRHQMTRATYDTILQGTVLIDHNKNRYVVGVHNEMAKEWLENRLHDIVQRALANVVDAAVTIEFKLTN